MGCFGCLDVPCKIGVPSMTINELVKWELAEKKPHYPPEEVFPTQLTLSQQGTTPEEFKRITSPDFKNAEVLFFPGCNIYNQPDKLLNALTVLDEIGNGYAFAPGLEYCCGMARGCIGDAQWAQNKGEKLMALAEKLNIQTMVFWCPTCLCVLEDRIKKFDTPSFRCISFGQYVYENIHKLSFPEAKPQKITYHEPCKTAYMGIDMYVREILTAIPGTTLVEMAHHGADTICCGCDAVNTAPDVGNRITERRLDEAAATSCGTMIDTCHYCHWVFHSALHQKKLKKTYNFAIENYVTYITKAMGKARPDTLFK